MVVRNCNRGGDAHAYDKVNLSDRMFLFLGCSFLENEEKGNRFLYVGRVNGNDKRLLQYVCVKRKRSGTYIEQKIFVCVLFDTITIQLLRRLLLGTYTTYWIFQNNGYFCKRLT